MSSKPSSEAMASVCGMPALGYAQNVQGFIGRGLAAFPTTVGTSTFRTDSPPGPHP